MNAARRWLALGAAALAAALPTKASAQSAGQTLNPPYLAGLPAVERVARESQGDNPTDTLARQAAVMTNLSQIVKCAQMAPGRRYGVFTPDELKVIGNFELAAYQIGQSYAKSHSADEAKAFMQLQVRYEMNDAVFKQTFALLSPALLAEFGRTDAAVNAYQQAHVEQQRRESEQARAQAAPAPGAGSSPFVRNDPGTLAVRRCLELGGGELECIGKGLSTGLMDMAGVNPEALKGPAAAGLRIGGTFQGDDAPGIAFGSDSANLLACGKLVAQARKYSVAKRGNQLLVEIQNELKPLLVVLGPEGRFTGPAAIDISGQVVVGYNRYWVQERRVSDNSVVAGSGGVAVPLSLQADGTLAGSGIMEVNGRVVTGTDAKGATFASRAARCNVGSLAVR